MSAYYNEHNPYAAAVLRTRIADGSIPAGDVDERSIVDVQPSDLRGYRQCHLFAGAGGWALAARLAGWPDDRELWSGSPPCQPWSIAGPGTGAADERHLSPEFCRLVRGCRPAGIVGEQVPRAVSRGWFDALASSLEADDYAVRAAVAPACAVGTFHRRDRLFFVAHSRSARLSSAEQTRRSQPRYQVADQRQAAAERDRVPPWRDHRLSVGHDGIARMVQPGVRLMAHGIPDRVDVLGAIGNAIVPQLGAIVIKAYMDCCP